MKPHGVSSTLLLLSLAFHGFSCGSLMVRGSRDAHGRAADSNGPAEALASTSARSSGRPNVSVFEDITSTLDSVSRVIDKVEDVRGAMRGTRKRSARVERSHGGRSARDDAAEDESSGARSDTTRVGGSDRSAEHAEESEASTNDEGDE